MTLTDILRLQRQIKERTGELGDAIKDVDGKKLNVSGGKMTGPLDMNGNALLTEHVITATNGNTYTAYPRGISYSEITSTNNTQTTGADFPAIVGIVETTNLSSWRCSQLFFLSGGNAVFRRDYRDGTWTSWETVPMRSDVLGGVRRRNHNANALMPNQFMQMGWGYVTGNGTQQLTTSVTFPVAFDDVPIVVVNALGRCRATANGAPTGPGHTDSNVNPRAYGGNESVTASGFTAYIERYNGNLLNTYYYLYTWMAVGTKA